MTSTRHKDGRLVVTPAAPTVGTPDPDLQARLDRLGLTYKVRLVPGVGAGTARDVAVRLVDFQGQIVAEAVNDTLSMALHRALITAEHPNQEHRTDAR